MKKKQLIWLGLFIVLIIAILLSDSWGLSQPSKLKGEFTEVAFFRNQNNAGPVVRIYAVTVKNPKDALYNEYGTAMPYTLHGNTKVFFFDSKTPAPRKLNFDYPYFDTTSYKPIFIYERNGADVITLKKNTP